MSFLPKIQPPNQQNKDLEIKKPDIKQKEEVIASKNLKSKKQQESGNIKGTTLKEAWNTLCGLMAKAADKVDFFKLGLSKGILGLKITERNAKQVEKPKVETKDPNKPSQIPESIEKAPVKVFYPPEGDLPLKDLVGYLAAQVMNPTLKGIGLKPIEEKKYVDALIKFVEYNTSFLAKSALDGLEGKIKLKIDALKQKGGDWKTAEVMAKSAEKLLKVARDAIDECCGLKATSLKTDIEHPELELGEKRDLGKAFKTIATLLATLNKEYPGLIKDTFVPALTKLLFDRDFMQTNYFYDTAAYKLLGKALSAGDVDKIVNKLVNDHILGAEEPPIMQDLSEVEDPNENEDYILVTKGTSEYDLSGKTFEEVGPEFNMQLVKAFYDDIVKPVDDMQKGQVKNLELPCFPNLKKVFNEGEGAKYANQYNEIMGTLLDKELKPAVKEDVKSAFVNVLESRRQTPDITPNIQKPEEKLKEPSMLSKVKNVLKSPEVSSEIAAGGVAVGVKKIGDVLNIDENINIEIAKEVRENLQPVVENAIKNVDKSIGEVGEGVQELKEGKYVMGSIDVAGGALGVGFGVAAGGLGVGGTLIKAGGQIAIDKFISPDIKSSDIDLSGAFGVSQKSSEDIQKEVEQKKIAEEQNVAAEKKIKTDAKIQTLVDLSKSIQEKIKNIGKETTQKNIIQLNGEIWKLKDQLKVVAEDKNNPVAQDPDVKKLLDKNLFDATFNLKTAIDNLGNDPITRLYGKIRTLEKDFTVKVGEKEMQDLVALVDKEITSGKLPENFEKNFSEAMNTKITSPASSAKMVEDGGLLSTWTAKYPLDPSFYDALELGKIDITNQTGNKDFNDVKFDSKQANAYFGEGELDNLVNQPLFNIHKNLGGGSNDDNTDCLKLLTQIASPDTLQTFIDQLHLDQQGITVGKKLNPPLTIEITSVGKDQNGVETLTCNVKALFPIEKVVGNEEKDFNIDPAKSFVNTQFTCEIKANPAKTVKGWTGVTNKFTCAISNPYVLAMKLTPMKVV